MKTKKCTGFVIEPPKVEQTRPTLRFDKERIEAVCPGATWYFALDPTGELGIVWLKDRHLFTVLPAAPYLRSES